MILPIPPIGFSFVAVPVWQLETVPADDPPAADAPAPTTGAWGCETVVEASPPPPPPPTTTRWVFKGYEWRPFPTTWQPFVNPGWDHLVDNDPRDIHERAIRQEQERQANEAAALAKAERSRAVQPPGPAGLDNAHGDDNARRLSSGNSPSSDAPQWSAAEAPAKLDPKRTSP